MIDSPLKPLTGRWATTIRMLHPPEAKGQTHHAVDTYRFLPGGAVLVHDVEAVMGDQTVISIEIYTASEDGGFVSRNFDNQGVVSDYRATMRDGVWSVTGETERFTSTALTPDRIEGLWRLNENGAWTDWMTVTLNRVGAA